MKRLPEISEITNHKKLSKQEKIQCFDECYAALHQAVYGNILKLVKEPGLAEDLLQDVFLVLWENLDKLDRERIPNWIFVVSFNKSISSLKNLRKNKDFEESGHFEGVFDASDIDEEAFEQKLQMIYNAIDLLPAQKKEIFKMYRFEGKSLDEISSKMHLSKNTVKDHLKIAHKTLKDRLFKDTADLYKADLILFLIFFL